MEKREYNITSGAKLMAKLRLYMINKKVFGKNICKKGFFILNKGSLILFTKVRVIIIKIKRCEIST